MRARERARYERYQSLYPDRFIDRSMRNVTQETIDSLSISVSMDNGRSFTANGSVKRGTVKKLVKLYRGRAYALA